MTKYIVIFFAALLLGGCATAPKGCDGMPEGITCMPVDEIMALTDDPYYSEGVSASRIANHGNSQSNSGGTNSTVSTPSGNQNKETVGPEATAQFGRLIIQEGQPDRVAIINPPTPDGLEPEYVPAQKHRIWLAPYVDGSQGVWVSAQVLFITTADPFYKNGIDLTNERSADVFQPLK